MLISDYMVYLECHCFLALVHDLFPYHRGKFRERRHFPFKVDGCLDGFGTHRHYSLIGSSSQDGTSKYYQRGSNGRGMQEKIEERFAGREQRTIIPAAEKSRT